MLITKAKVTRKQNKEEMRESGDAASASFFFFLFLNVLNKSNIIYPGYEDVEV